MRRQHLGGQLGARATRCVRCLGRGPLIELSVAQFNQRQMGWWRAALGGQLKGAHRFHLFVMRIKNANPI